MSLPELFQRTRQRLNITNSGVTPEALPGTPTVISFTMEPQRAEFWCWAAVASSVSHHYTASSQWTQCLVVNAVRGVSHCCGNENSPTCNVMSSLESALRRTGNLAPNGVLNAPASPDQIQTLIRDRRHVIACGIRWADSRGHFVVIYGFSIAANGVLWVAVADPKYGPSEYPYPAFVNRYRETGRWLVSYATEP